MRSVRRALGGVCLVLATLAWWAGPAIGQRFVFVSDDGTAHSDVSVFAVGATGQLTEVPGSPFSTGASSGGADAVVVTPDGSHVYVANSAGSVSGFSVGGSGALTTLTGSPWTAGTGPVGLAITPNGKFMFATNAGSGNVSGYAVENDGTLTPLAGSPTSLGSGQAGAGFPAITPNGEFLYVPDQEGVVAFAIGSDGSLSAAPGSPYALSGTLATPSAGVTPNGTELLVGMGYGINQIAAYSIATDGALGTVQGSPFNGPSSQIGMGISDLAISPTGSALYATDGSALAGMSIAANGALTALPESPFPYPGSSSQPQAIAVAPGGSEAFADDPGNSLLQPYLVGADGALTENGSSDTAGPTPDQGSIAVSPDPGPTAALATTAAPAGSASTFDASKSTAVEGTIVRYSWSFGDGSAATTSTPTTTHVYAAAGTYMVSVTVTTGDDCSTSGPFTGQSPSCSPDPGASASSGVTISPAPAVLPPPATTTHKTFGDQRVTLVTPAGSLCQVSTGTLPAMLSEIKLAHGNKLEFKSAAFYIDKGIKHTHKEKKKVKRHGKQVTVTIEVTTYLPNAAATKLPASEHPTLTGLRAGTHMLTVKLSYRHTKRVTVRRHGKRTKVKKTVTITRTMTVIFTVC